MKKLISLFLTFSLLSLSALTKNWYIKPEVEEYFSSGNLKWSTYFPGEFVTNYFNYVGIVSSSHLNFNTDSDITILGLEAGLDRFKFITNPFLKLNIGFGDIKGDNGYDIDKGWGYVWPGYISNTFAYGEFYDVSGDYNYFSITIGAQIFKKEFLNRSLTVRGYLGYEKNKQKAIIRDCVYSWWGFQPIPPTKLSGLDSFYKFEISGLKLGVKADYELLKPELKYLKKINLIAYLEELPDANIKGFGWWNLRGLEFHHSGSSWGLRTGLGLEFNITKTLNFEIGYKYSKFTGSGEEEEFSNVNWHVKTQRKGVYLKLSYKF